jgi:hypothetical protein
MPDILTPFPNIAVHIVQAKQIGKKLPHYRRLLPVFSLRF